MHVIATLFPAQENDTLAAVKQMKHLVGVKMFRERGASLAAVTGRRVSIGLPPDRSPAIGKAFTLIETVIVVAIIGILTAAAVPLLAKSVQGEKALYAAQELVSRFNSARGYAISGNTYSKFIFETSDDKYYIQVYNPDTSTWATVDTKFSLPSNIHFVSGSITFTNLTATFDPFGSLSQGGQVAITNGSGFVITMQSSVANGQLKKVG